MDSQAPYTLCHDSGPPARGAILLLDSSTMSIALRRGGKTISIVRESACCRFLITVSLLLVCTALGSAQSGNAQTADSSECHRGLHVAPSLAFRASSRFSHRKFRVSIHRPFAESGQRCPGYSQSAPGIAVPGVYSKRMRHSILWRMQSLNLVNGSRGVVSDCSIIPAMACR